MFSIDFLKSVLNVSFFGNKNSVAEDIVINSLEVKKNDCFIGLLGTKIDGSNFFEDALKKGAIGLILNKSFQKNYLEIKDNYPFSWAFFVDDSKLALLKIAKKWRSVFHIPVIAVTGSVGKTTTKEMLKSIYEKEGYHVCATKSSLNSTTGLPLSILKLRSFHQIAIFEVGIQKIGEMDILIDVLQQVTYSIVTTILPSHIEHFISLENIIKEKIKLQGITMQAFFIDYNFKKYIQHKNMFTIGVHENASFCYQLMATKIAIDIAAKNKNYNIDVLYHDGLRHCLVLAFAVAFIDMIKPKNIIYALENFERIPGRFSVHRLKKGGIIINDSYNAANPTVMLTSILAFEVFPVNKKKILVLGDMLEQGVESDINHSFIINKVNELSKDIFDTVYYVGDQFIRNNFHNKRGNVIFVKTFLEIADEIYHLLDNQCCVLLKSSRGMLFFHHITNYLEKINKE